MKTLLVNTPEGGQALIELQDGGSYYYADAVLWDTSIDGDMPEIQLGGMVRIDGALEVDAVLLAAATNYANTKARAAVWEQIKAHRQRLSDTGGYYVASVDKWFHSDPASKTQQLALVRLADKIEAAGGDMDAQFPGTAGQWKTLDGTLVSMTATLANAIFDAAAAQDGALFARAEMHRAALNLAPDPAAYDWSTGWPAVYGGA